MLLAKVNHVIYFSQSQLLFAKTSKHRTACRKAVWNDGTPGMVTHSLLEHIWAITLYYIHFLKFKFKATVVIKVYASSWTTTCLSINNLLRAIIFLRIKIPFWQLTQVCPFIWRNYVCIFLIPFQYTSIRFLNVSCFGHLYFRVSQK